MNRLCKATAYGVDFKGGQSFGEGQGLTNRYGDTVYGKTTGSVQPVRDSSGQVTDVKGHVETIIDPALAKQDRDDAVPHAPESDAKLLGHELKHDEDQFFENPDSEEIADQGIDDILSKKPTAKTKLGAEEFVDKLLQPNTVLVNQNNEPMQDQLLFPPERCVGDIGTSTGAGPRPGCTD